MKYILNCLFLLLITTTSAESPPIEQKGLISIKQPEIVKPIDVTERINDLAVLHPAFRNKVVRLLYEAKKQGIELEVLETYRTPERQDMLRKRGFSMVRGGRSKHQHYIAVDVVPVKFGWYLWNDRKLWKKIGKIGEAQGLIWGGRWRKLYDPGHFEFPIDIDSLHTLSIPDTVLIPLNY